MPQMYTEENFIKLLYGEADLFDKLELEFALEEDSTLEKHHTALMEVFEALPPLSYSPSEKTIQQILAYSSNA